MSKLLPPSLLQGFETFLPSQQTNTGEGYEHIINDHVYVVRLHDLQDGTALGTDGAG